ncbi:SDR family NAD(P)-dependent oxidoreductase [Pseudoduganella sp. R-43]|uniref:SDR family NAD(P)-dependent oxidoreductase n=1 Tax=unclassified Pseudoduganella TaxID=2637179 RepID=UPI003CF012D2
MRVMIIGGTSGIGLALAGHYAQQGAELALCGRDPSRLDGHPIAAQAGLRRYGFDIGDRQAVFDAVGDFAQGGLDLLIVTAGQYADAAALAQDRMRSLPVVRTNVSGLCHAFDAGAQAMLHSGCGQMVVVASIAGLLHEYPNGSLYSASKRAAIAISDSYRKALAPHGIDVTAVVPGYVDTQKLRDLNGGSAQRKPFLQTEEEAVRRITRAIAGRQARCIFPWQLHAMVRVFNLLPKGVQRYRKK